jgi:catechol 2,3-dioxygenase-like lactoylglutathione lyase family enzyme
MSGTTLVHVGIAATDLEKSVRFWRDVLGLKEVGTLHLCYDLSDGYHNFRLFQHELGERPPHVTGLSAYLHLGVKVSNLQATVERCLEMGVPITWEDVANPQAVDPDNLPTRSFKVEDPDGIVVDVTGSDDQWPGVGLS